MRARSEIVICTVPDCGMKVKALGLCGKHHQRWYRTGHTESKRFSTNRGETATEHLAGLRYDMCRAGIFRTVDPIGRIVLPKTFENIYGDLSLIHLEFFIDTEAGAIAMLEYKAGCCFCKSQNFLIPFKEKKICPDCLIEFRGGAK